MRKYKVSILFSLIFSLFFVTGCSHFAASTPTDPLEQPLNINELALAYMENKYGESFTYLAPWGNSMSGNREILVTCESFPNEPILVQVENFKSANKVYRDNFHAVKFQNDVVDYFEAIACDYFGTVNVFHTPSKIALSSGLSADTDFETYYSNPSTVVSVLIEIKSSNFIDSSDLEDYMKNISDTHGLVTISFVVVNDDIFGSMGRDELNDLVAQGNVIFSAHGEVTDGIIEIDCD